MAIFGSEIYDFFFTTNPQTKEFIANIDVTPEVRNLIFNHIENAYIEGYHQGFHKGYFDGQTDSFTDGFDEAERQQ